MVLAAALYLAAARRADGSDRVDAKVLYYLEAGDRMQIVSPAIRIERDLSQTLTLSVDGIYNSIAGATPTGAPPIPRTVIGVAKSAMIDPSWFDAVAGATGGGGGDGGGGGGGSERGSSGSGSSGPTTVRRPIGPLISSTSYLLPMAEVKDTRIGANAELTQHAERFDLTGVLSFSTEDDYDSLGTALRHGIHFNEKNTTLMLGAAYTHDIVHAVTMPGPEKRETVDVIAGIRQLLGPGAFIKANLALGRSTGYQTDPYKVVSMNGRLVSERRPSRRDKQVFFVSITRLVELLDASVEADYRLFSDSFGIVGNTVGLAWRQRLGSHLILEPELRLHEQSEANFYEVRFTGDPDVYSSDYRLSALQSVSFGGRVVWQVRRRWSVDAGYERYELTGLDGETADIIYPQADIVTGGVKLWF